MRQVLFLTVLGLAALIVGAATAARAQGVQAGSLRGVVKNQQGAVVAGAMVVVVVNEMVPIAVRGARRHAGLAAAAGFAVAAFLATLGT